jgi:hypothetical protein
MYDKATGDFRVLSKNRQFAYVGNYHQKSVAGIRIAPSTAQLPHPAHTHTQNFVNKVNSSQPVDIFNLPITSANWKIDRNAVQELMKEYPQAQKQLQEFINKLQWGQPALTPIRALGIVQIPFSLSIMERVYNELKDAKYHMKYRGRVVNGVHYEDCSSAGSKILNTILEMKGIKANLPIYTTYTLSKDTAHFVQIWPFPDRGYKNTTLTIGDVIILGKVPPKSTKEGIKTQAIDLTVPSNAHMGVIVGYVPIKKGKKTVWDYVVAEMGRGGLRFTTLEGFISRDTHIPVGIYRYVPIKRGVIERWLSGRVTDRFPLGYWQNPAVKERLNNLIKTPPKDQELMYALQPFILTKEQSETLYRQEVMKDKILPIIARRIAFSFENSADAFGTRNRLITLFGGIPYEKHSEWVKETNYVLNLYMQPGQPLYPLYRDYGITPLDLTRALYSVFTNPDEVKKVPWWQKKKLEAELKQLDSQLAQYKIPQQAINTLWAVVNNQIYTGLGHTQLVNKNGYLYWAPASKFQQFKNRLAMLPLQMYDTAKGLVGGLISFFTSPLLEAVQAAASNRGDWKEKFLTALQSGGSSFAKQLTDMGEYFLQYLDPHILETRAAYNLPQFVADVLIGKSILKGAIGKGVEVASKLPGIGSRILSEAAKDAWVRRTARAKGIPMAEKTMGDLHWEVFQKTVPLTEEQRAFVNSLVEKHYKGLSLTPEEAAKLAQEIESNSAVLPYLKLAQRAYAEKLYGKLSTLDEIREAVRQQMPDTPPEIREEIAKGIYDIEHYTAVDAMTDYYSNTILRAYHRAGEVLNNIMTQKAPLNYPVIASTFLLRMTSNLKGLFLKTSPKWAPVFQEYTPTFFKAAKSIAETLHNVVERMIMDYKAAFARAMMRAAADKALEPVYTFMREKWPQSENAFRELETSIVNIMFERARQKYPSGAVAEVKGIPVIRGITEDNRPVIDRDELHKIVNNLLSSDRPTMMRILENYQIPLEKVPTLDVARATLREFNDLVQGILYKELAGRMLLTPEEMAARKMMETIMINTGLPAHAVIPLTGASMTAALYSALMKAIEDRFVDKPEFAKQVDIFKELLTQDMYQALRGFMPEITFKQAKELLGAVDIVDRLEKIRTPIVDIQSALRYLEIPLLDELEKRAADSLKTIKPGKNFIDQFSEAFNKHLVDVAETHLGLTIPEGLESEEAVYELIADRLRDIYSKRLKQELKEIRRERAELRKMGMDIDVSDLGLPDIKPEEITPEAVAEEIQRIRERVFTKGIVNSYQKIASNPLVVEPLVNSFIELAKAIDPEMSEREIMEKMKPFMEEYLPTYISRMKPQTVERINQRGLEFMRILAEKEQEALRQLGEIAEREPEKVEEEDSAIAQNISDLLGEARLTREELRRLFFKPGQFRRMAFGIEPKAATEQYIALTVNSVRQAMMKMALFDFIENEIGERVPTGELADYVRKLNIDLDDADALRTAVASYLQQKGWEKNAFMVVDSKWTSLTQDEINALRRQPIGPVHEIFRDSILGLSGMIDISTFPLLNLNVINELLGRDTNLQTLFNEAKNAGVRGALAEIPSEVIRDMIENPERYRIISIPIETYFKFFTHLAKQMKYFQNLYNAIRTPWKEMASFKSAGDALNKLATYVNRFWYQTILGWPPRALGWIMGNVYSNALFILLHGLNPLDAFKVLLKPALKKNLREFVPIVDQAFVSSIDQVGLQTPSIIWRAASGLKNVITFIPRLIYDANQKAEVFARRGIVWSLLKKILRENPDVRRALITEMLKSPAGISWLSNITDLNNYTALAENFLQSPRTAFHPQVAHFLATELGHIINNYSVTTPAEQVITMYAIPFWKFYRLMISYYTAYPLRHPQAAIIAFGLGNMLERRHEQIFNKLLLNVSKARELQTELIAGSPYPEDKLPITTTPITLEDLNWWVRNFAVPIAYKKGEDKLIFFSTTQIFPAIPFPALYVWEPRGLTSSPWITITERLLGAQVPFGSQARLLTGKNFDIYYWRGNWYLIDPTNKRPPIRLNQPWDITYQQNVDTLSRRMLHATIQTFFSPAVMWARAWADYMQKTGKPIPKWITYFCIPPRLAEQLTSKYGKHAPAAEAFPGLIVNLLGLDINADDMDTLLREKQATELTPREAREVMRAYYRTIYSHGMQP